MENSFEKLSTKSNPETLDRRGFREFRTAEELQETRVADALFKADFVPQKYLPSQSIPERFQI